MRVLALSPGPLALQLDRLPALVSLCEQVGATLQVACAPVCRGAWELILLFLFYSDLNKEV